MELKINIDYNQILGLINQLPKTEKEKIAIVLQTEISAISFSEFSRQLLLDAPTWDDPDFKNYIEARNHINNSRIA